MHWQLVVQCQCQSIIKSHRVGFRKGMDLFGDTATSLNAIVLNRNHEILIWLLSIPYLRQWNSKWPLYHQKGALFQS